MHHTALMTCCTRAPRHVNDVCVYVLALPDLVPNATLLQYSTYLQDRQLFYLQCAMEEGCASSSAYTLKATYPSSEFIPDLFFIETRWSLQFVKILRTRVAESNTYMQKRNFVVLRASGMQFSFSSAQRGGHRHAACCDSRAAPGTLGRLTSGRTCAKKSGNGTSVICEQCTTRRSNCCVPLRKTLSL